MERRMAHRKAVSKAARAGIEQALADILQKRNKNG